MGRCGGCGGRACTTRSAISGSRRQTGSSGGPALRAGAGGCAMHRDRHVATQSGCADSRLRADDLEEFLPKQAGYWIRPRRLVRIGGRLVYATCSLLDRGGRGPGVRLPVAAGRFRPFTARAGLAPGGRAPMLGRISVPHAAAARDGTGCSARSWSGGDMSSVRRARPADAVAIGAVHVSAWRSAYPGILPRQFPGPAFRATTASHYDSCHSLRRTGVLCGDRLRALTFRPAPAPRIIGFATAGRARLSDVSGRRLAGGRDWRHLSSRRLARPGRGTAG